MKIVASKQRLALGRIAALGAAILLLAAVAPAQEKADWQPTQPMPEKFDWIQLTTDEWLKGELIAMYQDSLEFDSAKFDDVTFDFVTSARFARRSLFRSAFSGETWPPAG